MPKNPAARFPVLDLLRGVAAVAVALSHAEEFLGVPANSPLCVDLFFVLSGFVLGHAYDHRLANGMSGAAFMRARLIRLYPLYLVGLALGVLALHDQIRGVPELMAVACALAFLPTSLTPLLYPFNPPAWSLFFELAINVVYGFSRPARLGVLVSVMAASLVIVTLTYGTLHLGSAWPTVGGGLARVGFSFFAGQMVWRFYARRERAPLPSWIAFLLAAAFIAAVAVPPWLAVELPLVLVGFPVLIYLAARTPLSGPLGKLATQAGLASYPLYVIHYPMLRLLAPHLEPGPMWWLVIAALVPVSIALERYVHEPVKSWLQQSTRIDDLTSPGQASGTHAEDLADVHGVRR
jgi:peptidoglycan/LPS O-acetylase OafA/YrhL